MRDACGTICVYELSYLHSRESLFSPHFTVLLRRFSNFSDTLEHAHAGLDVHSSSSNNVFRQTGPRVRRCEMWDAKISVCVSFSGVPGRETVSQRSNRSQAGFTKGHYRATLFLWCLPEDSKNAQYLHMSLLFINISVLVFQAGCPWISTHAPSDNSD
jgi:hypothetical protein